MKIIETLDYDQFKFLDENRRISQSHVSRLEDSISRENLLNVNPIFVDKKMNVIDGQHRLKAASKLKIPIYYTVLEVSNTDTLFLLQNSIKWGIADYVNFYSKTDPSKGYRIFNDFSELYSISTIAVCKLLGLFNENQQDYNKRISVKRIKEGYLNLNGVNLDLMHESLEKYDLFRGFCEERKIRPSSIYNTTRAIFSFCGFYAFYKPDWDRFMSQLADRWHILRPTRGYLDYTKDLVQIYNFKQTRKLLAFERFEKRIKMGNINIPKVKDIARAKSKELNLFEDDE